jgi:tetratricopeptide (TPR) repeat protein
VKANFLKGDIMRKTIIFTVLGFAIGLALGCIITMASTGYKIATAMFMLQEKEIYEMEEAAVQAYHNQPNEVAIWALENYIKTLNRLKEERSSAEVENPYLILSPAQSLVLTHARLGQLYKKMGYVEKSKHNFEQAMANIESAGLKAIKTEEDLIALIKRLDQEIEQK